MPSKFRHKKRGNRIWINNKLDKPRSSIRKKGRIIPVLEKCKKCGKRTRNHHFFCDNCWDKHNKT